MIRITFCPPITPLPYMAFMAVPEREMRCRSISLVDDIKSHVVLGPVIFFARIAQADDQIHPYLLKCGNSTRMRVEICHFGSVKVNKLGCGGFCSLDGDRLENRLHLLGHGHELVIDAGRYLDPAAFGQL